jgi:hypothetical protein
MSDLTDYDERLERRRKAIESLFGLWKNREGGPIDGLTYQNEIRAEWDERELEQYRGHPTPEHLIDVELDLNIKRIQEALDSPSIQMPNNMTREEKRAFILEHGKKD